MTNIDFSKEQEFDIELLFTEMNDQCPPPITTLNLLTQYWRVLTMYY